MRFLAAAALAATLAAQAHAGGWATVHRYVRPTGKCGAMREVLTSHYCVPGGPLAGGGRMNCGAVTTATWEYPMHSWIFVVNLHNGRTARIFVNDTGPNGLARSEGDVLDLSSGAAAALGTGGNTIYLCVSGGEYAKAVR